MDEVELTQELVKINSENPSGNEKEVAKYIYDYLTSLKFDPELVEFGENRYNVVTSVGKGEGLMLNTHTDTVPVGDMENWKYDPFSARLENGRIYGRGSSDSKSGVASILIALKNNAPRNFKRKLLIALVGDEEVAQGGSKFLIEKSKDLFKDVKYGIISDSDYSIAIAQKGILHTKIIFKGKAAHGSELEKGVNAIAKAAKFIDKIEELQKMLEKRKDPMLGFGTVSIGKVLGGTKVNIVADRCEVEVDRRLTWRETPDSALKQFKNLLSELKLDAKIELLNEPRSAVKTKENSKLVELLKNIDKNLKVTGKSGYTEMELYIRELGLECVACGPIEEGAAHTSNEFVEVSTIKKVTSTFTEAIKRWCC